MPRLNTPAELEILREKLAKKQSASRPCITVCCGTGCRALGSVKLVDAFRSELAKQGLENQVDIKETGCHGFCEKGSVVVIYPQNICYFHVKSEDAADVIEKTIKTGELVERLLYADPATGEKLVYHHDIPFYKYQKRIVLGDNEHINPQNIEDYIQRGGYSALVKTLFHMTPESVLEEVDKANLRGRGGGGFPAGKKWRTTRDAADPVKYVLVNCDEGDPGAFMDRSIMEGNPHCVLEGLAIGAFAIGAKEGYIYVRAEYPLAVENLYAALRQAEEYGLLGKNILGSGFDFVVKVHEGAGAFVSGESSALMTAIEGRVGEPRPKYIRTAIKGLWDKPSNLNNVETWANVPHIINKGADWFRSIGTEGSKGTKIFALVGKVNNTGLVEVPMGTTLRDIIFKIGGGLRDGKKIKAVQTGGPSGGCIPENLLDSPVDYDALSKLGSMVGSGGLIIMDEETCMVDIARYFINFLSDESCGKCLPCREGLRQLVDILTRITEGKGTMVDMDTLEDLSGVMSEACLCALGQQAPNPLLTTLKYFRHEYIDHIKNKHCEAGVCKALLTFYIDPDKCKACMICARNCPTDAIKGGKGLIHTIEQGKCIKCGACVDTCPAKFDAVIKISGKPIPKNVPAEPIPLNRKAE
ncbi:NADH dehydrogenase [Dehalococcoides mccartyi]|uniref:NADH-ubiquinone oxidoreductase-F iron-sulfur binding region domain-containing protein n=1 Tax=Dehalococcoides mccartyi TaxID=61435 RepID=UPI0002B76E3E|nr:NADH-ubiquinone oxidoreductase-F iron-sulfur binding region domain-containing protein [Dehalococcoides mccartyi]AGG07874.1 energy converting NiFe hydrogenase NADH binding subunit [Dehalococcoides mccartyi BTF08]AQW62428.1 NADH dehydrogenase [Dehalococcoides mccartyi]KSV17074.1 NADH dehydrogenase [Dehalococcoides mccartyi]PKH46638.1 NADH dehydrogenase [Dehalococcoides mccartyi]